MKTKISIKSPWIFDKIIFLITIMHNIYYHNKPKMSLNTHDYDEKKRLSLKDLSENGKEKLANLSDDELQQLKQKAVEAEDYDIAKMIKQEQVEREEKVPETEESTEEKRDYDAEYKAIQEKKDTSHAENLKKAKDLMSQLNETIDDEIDKKEKIKKYTNEISKEIENSSNQIENLKKESEEILSEIDEFTKEIQEMREDFRAWKWAYYWSHVVFSPERIKKLWYKIQNVEQNFNKRIMRSNETHQITLDENKKISKNIGLLYNDWNPLIWKKDLKFFANLHNIKDNQDKNLSSIEEWIYNSILKKELNVSMLWEVFQWIWIINGNVAQEILWMMRNIYNNAKFKSNIQTIKQENTKIKWQIYDFWNFVFNKR